MLRLSGESGFYIETSRTFLDSGVMTRHRLTVSILDVLFYSL